jgi:hypothetical protein
MDLDTIHDVAAGPEFRSVAEFVEFCLDDDRETFTHIELRALALNTRTSGSRVRAELEGFGLTLQLRRKENRRRGFATNSHDRWYGPGSSKSHGGSGWEQITGFAGRAG